MLQEDTALKPAVFMSCLPWAGERMGASGEGGERRGKLSVHNTEVSLVSVIRGGYNKSIYSDLTLNSVS